MCLSPHWQFWRIPILLETLKLRINVNGLFCYLYCYSVDKLVYFDFIYVWVTLEKGGQSSNPWQPLAIHFPTAWVIVVITMWCNCNGSVYLYLSDANILLMSLFVFIFFTDNVQWWTKINEGQVKYIVLYTCMLVNNYWFLYYKIKLWYFKLNDLLYLHLKSVGH